MENTSKTISNSGNYPSNSSTIFQKEKNLMNTQLGDYWSVTSSSRNRSPNSIKNFTYVETEPKPKKIQHEKQEKNETNNDKDEKPKSDSENLKIQNIQKDEKIENKTQEEPKKQKIISAGDLFFPKNLHTLNDTAVDKVLLAPSNEILDGTYWNSIDSIRRRSKPTPLYTEKWYEQPHEQHLVSVGKTAKKDTPKSKPKKTSQEIEKEQQKAFLESQIKKQKGLLKRKMTIENAKIEKEKKLKEFCEGKKVFPLVYLGGIAVAENLEWLQANDIKCILNVTEGKNIFEEDFCYKKIGVTDSSETPIVNYFHEAATFIQDSIATLIHCQEGRSRSVAVIIAYAMLHQKLNLKEAYELLSAVSENINVNDGFLKQLMEFELNATDSIDNSIDFFKQRNRKGTVTLLDSLNFEYSKQTPSRSPQKNKKKRKSPYSRGTSGCKKEQLNKQQPKDEKQSLLNFTSKECKEDKNVNNNNDKKRSLDEIFDKEETEKVKQEKERDSSPTKKQKVFKKRSNLLLEPVTLSELLEANFISKNQTLYYKEEYGNVTKDGKIAWEDQIHNSLSAWARYISTTLQKNRKTNINGWNVIRIDSPEGELIAKVRERYRKHVDCEKENIKEVKKTPSREKSPKKNKDKKIPQNGKKTKENKSKKVPISDSSEEKLNEELGKSYEENLEKNLEVSEKNEESKEELNKNKESNSKTEKFKEELNVKEFEDKSEQTNDESEEKLNIKIEESKEESEKNIDESEEKLEQINEESEKILINNSQNYENMEVLPQTTLWNSNFPTQFFPQAGFVTPESLLINQHSQSTIVDPSESEIDPNWLNNKIQVISPNTNTEDPWFYNNNQSLDLSNSVDSLNISTNSLENLESNNTLDPFIKNEFQMENSAIVVSAEDFNVDQFFA